MPYIYLIGLGVGHLDYLTEQAKKIIMQCDLLLGAERLIENVKVLNSHAYACTIDEIEKMIESHEEVKTVGVVVSGDVGFYSLANRLRKKFKDKYPFSQITGISSMQYFMNLLGKPYDHLYTVSMHGREENILTKLRCHGKVFLLTGGQHSVQAICQRLYDYGLEDVKVYVGERLSYQDEKITKGTPKELKNQLFNSLSVMLIEQKKLNAKCFKGPGIPDEAFVRGKVPMTKAEIRAICLSKLQLFPEAIVYDIGAGTGSVTIEMAMQTPRGKVYALERNEEAIKLIKQNKKHFEMEHIEIRQVKCPDGIADLPPPDAVFIGGSGGELGPILREVLHKNSKVRIVITAITLETLAEALGYFKEYALTYQEVVQVTVASSKQVGNYHMMHGQNPIFILSGQGALDENKTNNNLSFTR